jgi:hypothetical protein
LTNFLTSSLHLTHIVLGSFPPFFGGPMSNSSLSLLSSGLMAQQMWWSFPSTLYALNAAIAVEVPILVGYRRRRFPWVGRVVFDRFVFLLHGLVFQLFLFFFSGVSACAEEGNKSFVQTAPASRCLFIEELRTIIWVHQHDDAFGSSISKPVGMLLAFSSRLLV